MAKKIYISNSLQQTKGIAGLLSSVIVPGDIVFLSGNLGSGKTTFIQGLARGLGIRERIISPTFIIVRRYKIKLKMQNAKCKMQRVEGKNANKNLKVFYHIDLYRAEAQADIKNLGIKEILSDKEAIVAIEWPEPIQDRKIKSRVAFRINLKDAGGNKREIEIWARPGRIL